MKLSDGYPRAEQLIRSSDYDIISFDLFDTLVYRPFFTNKCLLRLFSSHVFSEYQIDVEEMRISAQHDLQDPFATLKEIWEYIACRYHLDHELAAVLAEQEFEFDLRFLCRSATGKKLYDAAVSTNKKMIVLSDTYYTSAQIESILKKLGYNAIANIYASCECQAGKRSGALFQYAMARERVKDPKRLIHIGDNLKSDYAGAAALHLAAVHIPNDRQWFENNWNLIHKQMMDSKYEDAIWGTALHWFANRDEAAGGQDEDIALFAAFVIFPMLLHLAITLHTRSDVQKNDAYHSLNFVSRDGFLMKKAYDMLSEQFPDSVPSAYLYASRISCDILSKAHFKDLLYAPWITDDCTLRQFIKTAVSSDELQQILYAELDSNTLNMSVRDRAGDCQKALQKHEKELSDDFMVQKAAAWNYYAKCVDGSHRLLLVDCGFRGTISKLLTEGFHNEVLFDKFFLWEKPINRFHDASMGTKTYVLFSEKRGHCCASMAETFFSEPTGSCVGFRFNQAMEPVPRFEAAWYPQDMKHVVEQTQKIALELVADFSRRYEGMIPLLGTASMERCFSTYSAFSESEAARIFARIRFKESFSPQMEADSLLCILKKKQTARGKND